MVLAGLSRYKFQDGNFHVRIPESTASRDPASIVLPENLVQVQAYLRWERNGKHQYSDDKQKVGLVVHTVVY